MEHKGQNISFHASMAMEDTPHPLGASADAQSRTGALERLSHLSALSSKEAAEQYDAYVGKLADTVHHVPPEPVSSSNAASQCEEAGEFVKQHVVILDNRRKYLLGLLQRHQYGSNLEATSDLEHELHSVTLERNSWILVGYLHHHSRGVFDTRRMIDGWTPLEAQTSLGSAPFSHASVARDAYGSDALLTRNQCVVHWLEEVAALDSGPLLAENSSDLDLYLDKTHLQLRTRSQSSADTAHLVDHLDPDAATREERSIVRDDLEEERALMRVLWTLVRSGDIPRAAEVCQRFKQHWRTATFRGGRLWNDDQQEDDAQAVVGSDVPSRSLWKRACRKLARVATLPAEQAIYGALGGDVSIVGRHCSSWEDQLWCRFSALVQTQLEQALRSRLVQYKHPALTARSSTAVSQPASDSSPESIFVQLESSLDPAIKLATTEPYRRCQRLLCLRLSVEPFQLQGQAPSSSCRNPTAAHIEILKELHDTVVRLRDEHVQGASELATQLHMPSYLRFAVHLFLYLNPGPPEHWSSAAKTFGVPILETYMEYLQDRLPLLVPLYAQFLPDDNQVAFYSTFLRTLPSESRPEFRELAQCYFPHNVHAIVKRMVDAVIQDTDTDIPVSLTASFAAATPARSARRTRSRVATSSKRTPQLTPFSPSWPTEIGIGSLLRSRSSLAVESMLDDDAMMPSTDSDVTPQDMEKIEAIKCFNVTEMTTDALERVNTLFHHFTGRGQFVAAQQLHAVVSDLQLLDHTAHRLGQFEDDSKQGPQVTLENVQLVNLHRELQCWRLYIRCLQAYTTWAGRHFQRKKSSTPDVADATETSSCAEAFGLFRQVFQFPHGWLFDIEIPFGPSNNSRASDLEGTRMRCIPQLCFLAHSMFHRTGDYVRATELCTLLASASGQRLLSCFDQQQLRVFLGRLSMTQLQLRMQNRDVGKASAQ